MKMDASVDDSGPLSTAKTISGRWVVLAMFLFGGTMTGLLYWYWASYTAQFHELQTELAKVYPGSSPRVLAGKHKSHLDDSMLTIRVVMRIDYPPTDDRTRLIRERANRVAELLDGQVSESGYERYEIVFIHRPPEAESVTWLVKAPPQEFPLPLTGDTNEQVEIEQFSNPNESAN